MKIEAYVRRAVVLLGMLATVACGPMPEGGAGDTNDADAGGACRAPDVTVHSHSVSLGNGTRGIEVNLEDSFGNSYLSYLTSDGSTQTFVRDNEAFADEFDPWYTPTTVIVSLQLPDGFRPAQGQVLHLGQDFTIPLVFDYHQAFDNEYTVRNAAGDVTLTVVSATEWDLDGSACAPPSTDNPQGGYLIFSRATLHPQQQ